jgi:uncharacterized protein (TIGR03089 family)
MLGNVGVTGETIPNMLAAVVAADAARPLLTWYDDATAERVELSGATLANWVAKTANLLVDGCGFAPGESAGVRLPPHWQSAAVLLGCWSAGLVVTATGTADVYFTDPAGVAEVGAGDRYLLGFAPMGLPARDVPAGWLDYVGEVRRYGDVFTPAAPVGPSDPALNGPEPSSHVELVGRAQRRATELGIAGRVLIDAAGYPDPIDWLLAPLVAGASIVLCGHLDVAAVPARVRAENVDRALLSG